MSTMRPSRGPEPTGLQILESLLGTPGTSMTLNILPPSNRPFDRLSPEELDTLERAHRADRFHDQCGIFGVHGDEEASHLTYLGLYALQHRGQESCGIVASNGKEHIAHRAMGLVADTFGAEILDHLKGRHAIGHVRYSTTGGSMLRNAQPICANTDGGPVSIAHNGNLVNAGVIPRELEGRGPETIELDEEYLEQLGVAHKLPEWRAIAAELFVEGQKAA